MKQEYLAWVIKYPSAITTYYGDNDMPPTTGEISNAEEVWCSGIISKHKITTLIGHVAVLTQQDVHNCTRLGLNCSGWMVESLVRASPRLQARARSLYMRIRSFALLSSLQVVPVFRHTQLPKSYTFINWSLFLRRFNSLATSSISV